MTAAQRSGIAKKAAAESAKEDGEDGAEGGMKCKVQTSQN
jgi:hypothetical protein